MAGEEGFEPSHVGIKIRGLKPLVYPPTPINSRLFAELDSLFGIDD